MHAHDRLVRLAAAAAARTHGPWRARLGPRGASITPITPITPVLRRGAPVVCTSQKGVIALARDRR